MADSILKKPMTTLNEYLKKLSKLCPPPLHDRIRIVERMDEIGEIDAEGRCRVKAAVLHSPEEYAPRFEELLTRGYDWINLTQVGIQDGQLIVRVELPQQTTAAAVGRTSVRLWGVTNRVKEHNWALDALDLGLDTRPPAIHHRMHLVLDDITKLNVDAIVNPGQNSLVDGGALDGVINRAAGPEMREECLRLGGCATGDAKATKGYRLPCRYVIHTVGPVWREGQLTGEEDAQLASCYRRCLEVAEELGVTSIAFPAISTGVFGFPRARAAKIAVQTIRGFHSAKLEKVLVVAFDDETYAVYQPLLDLER